MLALRNRLLEQSPDGRALIGFHALDGPRGPRHRAKPGILLLARRTDALILDPVYTGVAMAGLVARAGDGTIAAGAHTLFLHTGGTPALFGYANELGRWIDPATA